MMELITGYAEHVITGVLALCVFLAARNNTWNWPIGLVGVTMYGASAWLLWGLYADALLQIFYFATGCYGWWYWTKGGAGKTPAPITDLTILQWGQVALIILLGTVGMGSYMAANTNSVVPYLDSFTTVTCFLAQIGLMRRIRSNWILWIIADIFYVYMFYVKGLNLLAVEYALFTLNAGYGFYVWTKEKNSYNHHMPAKA